MGQPSVNTEIYISFVVYTDKKFAVKARLCSMLPVTAGLLKRCQGDQRNLIPLLNVVKTLASNCEYIRTKLLEYWGFS